MGQYDLNKVNASDIYDHDLAAGRIAGMTHTFKFGYADALPNGTKATVWDGNNLYTYPPNAGLAMAVASSSVEDLLTTGDGAWKISIEGLDANFLLKTVIVDLNGQTEVDLPGTWSRIFRAQITEGSVTAPSQPELAGNLGTIHIAEQGTFTLGVATLPFAIIIPGNSQTLMAVYTVPAGKRMLIQEVLVTSQKSNTATIIFDIVARPFGTNGVFQLKDRFLIVQASLTVTHKTSVVINEKCDFEIRGLADAANQSASGAFAITLEDT